MVFQSCGYIETRKISAEEIYKQELKTINWNNVDTYPVFKNCDHLTEKELKNCFEQTLTATIYKTVSKLKKPVPVYLNDTLTVYFTISKDAVLKISNIKLDSIAQSQIPELKSIIIKSIDSLQPIAPAYKRGVPVKTGFKLPIVIVTD